MSSTTFIAQQFLLNPLQNTTTLLRNFFSIMGRSNFFPIDTQTFFKEVFEFIVITIFYPIITVVGLYLQFLRWLWTMVFRAAVPTPQQYSALQIKSAIITGANSEMAKSLALSLCEQWKIDISNSGNTNSNPSNSSSTTSEHKMLTLVGSDDKKLNSIREDIIRALGENCLKTTEIRVKVCSSTDEEKIRKIITEYDYDLVMTCPQEDAVEQLNEERNASRVSTHQRQSSSEVKEKQSPRKRDVKGSAITNGNRNESTIPTSTSSSSEQNESSSNISTTFIPQQQQPLNEENIRSQYEFNIFGTLNTVLPAIRQSRERGLTDSPKHVVVIGGNSPIGISSLFEFSRLIEGEVRRSSLRSGLAGQKINPNDFPNSSQLVFQVVTPLICQNVVSTLSSTFNSFLTNVLSESYSRRRLEKRRERGEDQDQVNQDETNNTRSVDNSNNRRGKDEIQTSSPRELFSSTVPLNVTDEIMRGVFRGVDVIDVNSPIVYAGLRLYNAVPVSVQNIISTLFQFNDQ